MNFQALLKTAAALTATIAISVWWQWAPITQAERVAGVVKQLQTAACRAAWREVQSYKQDAWGIAMGVKPFACMSPQDLDGLAPAAYELDVCKQRAVLVGNGPPDSCMSPLLGFKVPAHLKLVYAPTVPQGELDRWRCTAALEKLQVGQPWPFAACRAEMDANAAGILQDEKMSRQDFVSTTFGADQTGLFPGGMLATVAPSYPMWCRNPTGGTYVHGWGVFDKKVFCTQLPADERRRYEIIYASSFQHQLRWPANGVVKSAIPLPAVPPKPSLAPLTNAEALHELLGVPDGKRRTPQQIIQGVHP